MSCSSFSCKGKLTSTNGDHQIYQSCGFKTFIYSLIHVVRALRRPLLLQETPVSAAVPAVHHSIITLWSLTPDLWRMSVCVSVQSHVTVSVSCCSCRATCMIFQPCSFFAVWVICHNRSVMWFVFIHYHIPVVSAFLCPRQRMLYSAQHG